MKKKICLISIICCLFPATANAWGPSNCSVVPENHCYGLIKQEISGTAAFVHVINQGDYVPTGANPSKEFISNELWQGFNGSWLEMGEIIGPGIADCCTRYRFIGIKYPNRPLYVRVLYEEGTIPLNAEEIYGIEHCGNGIWCFIWNGKTISSAGGWPNKYTEREVGIEIATESKPSAYGRAMGREGNGEQWYPPLQYEMEPGICEGGEPGICGFNRFEGYSEINWGFGNGPHDEFGKHILTKSKKHKLSFPIPEKKGWHISGHMTFRRNHEGRINEVWVGKRPNHQELEGKY